MRLREGAEKRRLGGKGVIMGNFISTILSLFRPRHEQRQTPPPPKKDETFFLDPTIRQKVEKKLRDQGAIGGSALNAARGFETAYRRVMMDVSVSNTIKSELYTALAQEGGTKTYEKFLLPGQWEWPEFDEWKAIFTKDGKFPYMWNKYSEICMPPFDALALSTVLERLLVKDIKIFLNKAQIDIPLKSKKAALIAVAEQRLNAEIFRELMPEDYNKLKEEYARDVNYGRCATLSHTIRMLGYNLRDFYTNNRLKLFPIKGCPVEANYAKGKGRITEENIPPFFPGDRTGVTFIRRR